MQVIFLREFHLECKEILSNYIINVLNLTVSVYKSPELLSNVQRKVTCLEIANMTSTPVNHLFLKELLHIYDMVIDSYSDTLSSKEILSLDFIPLLITQLMKRRCLDFCGIVP